MAGFMNMLSQAGQFLTKNPSIIPMAMQGLAMDQALRAPSYDPSYHGRVRMQGLSGIGNTWFQGQQHAAQQEARKAAAAIAARRLALLESAEKRTADTAAARQALVQGMASAAQPQIDAMDPGATSEPQDMLPGMTPRQYLQSPQGMSQFLAIAPDSAFSQMFKPPSAPTVKDFYEGDKVVQKQWIPDQGWVAVGQGGPRFKPTGGGPFTLGEGQVRYDAAGNPIATGAPKKLTSIQEKIGILTSTGVPENIAKGIVAGRYKTDRHPINGTLQVVDMSNGKVIYRGDQQAPTGDPKAQSSFTFNDPASLPGGVDYSAATGGTGFFGNLGNLATGVFGGQMSPEVERAGQGLTNLQVRTQTALQAAIPGRPSNYLMEQLGKLSVEPFSLLQGDARSKERLRQTRDMIRSEINRMDRDILGQPSGFEPKQIAATRANRSQLQSLLRDYETALEGFGGGKKLSPEDDALVNKYLGGQ